MHLSSTVPHSPHLSNLGTIRLWKFVLIWKGKNLSHYLNSHYPNHNWVYWFIWLVTWVSLLNCLFIFTAYFFYCTVFWLIWFLSLSLHSLTSLNQNLHLCPLLALLSLNSLKSRYDTFPVNVLPKVSNEPVSESDEHPPSPVLWSCSTTSNYTLLVLHTTSLGVPSLDSSKHQHCLAWVPSLSEACLSSTPAHHSLPLHCPLNLAAAFCLRSHCCQPV